MKRSILKVIFILLSASLVGCTFFKSTSKPSQSYARKNPTLTLQQGITSKNAVIKAFGVPTRVMQKEEGVSEWVYQKNIVVKRLDPNGSFATFRLLGDDPKPVSYQNVSHIMKLVIVFHDNTVFTFKGQSIS